MSSKLFLSILSLFLLVSFPLISSVGASSVVWSQIFGGGAIDVAEEIVQTSDGGYAVAGWTGSIDGSDFWLIKIDSFGNMEWNRTYGKKGIGGDFANSLVETSDGGYALAGTTNSFGSGSYDFCLVRTDGAGNMLWNQTFGGSKIDQASAIVQTSDGGFAIAGYTQSFSNEYYDFWLIKTDSFGNMQWNRTYDQEGMSYPSSLIITSDGGFALGGEAFSEDGQFDFGMVKTDKDGDVEWTKTYGGEKWDRASSLVETSDGGFALAGETNSYGSGDYDFYLVITDEAGNMVWNQTFGGSENDRANSLVEASDGEFVIAGRTKSFGAGESDDLWLIKTDSTLTPTPTPEPESFPTTIVVVSIATIAVIATAILVYIKKYKK